MLSNLLDFLQAPTAYHVCDKAKQLLLKNGFQPLSEKEDWNLSENGKYFVERGGSALIAFTVGNLDSLQFKIAASHTDSPALKLKENPLKKGEAYTTLNVETYGGGIWHTFFDRALKLAGRVMKKEDGKIRCEKVESNFLLTIPSVAIHQNREVNSNFSVNAQIDLQPLFALNGEGVTLIDKLTDGEVISSDLFLVNADMPYSFGVNDEFLASPRIDNVSGVCSSLEALIANEQSKGICVAALLDNEEIGSRTVNGAGSDFLEHLLRRIAYTLRFDENEYYKALASSFLLSVDNGHALHPNHPEKSDPTNRPIMGKGVLIKSHANKAYTTDALTSAIVKTVFEKAEVQYQNFFNRSDMQSGSTLGVVSIGHLSIPSADIGLPQLAMHSACECIAKTDYNQIVKGITAFYASEINISDNEVEIL